MRLSYKREACSTLALFFTVMIGLSQCVYQQPRSGYGSPDATIRMKAIEANPTPEGLAELSAYLNSRDSYTSQHAAYHFVKLGNRAASQVPQLISTLDSPFENVRTNVCATLAQMGPQAAAALPKLEQLVQSDKSDAVRGNASSAVAIIGSRQGGACQADVTTESDSANLTRNTIDDLFAIAATQLLVYGNKGCGYTERFIEVLRKKNIQYDFRDLWSSPQNRADLNVIMVAGKKSGFWTYPAVVYKGKIYFSSTPRDIGTIIGGP